LLDPSTSGLIILCCAYFFIIETTLTYRKLIGIKKLKSLPCALLKLLYDAIPAPPAMPRAVNQHKAFSHDTAPFFYSFGSFQYMNVLCSTHLL
jgi:hypothetical protein